LVARIPRLRLGKRLVRIDTASRTLQFADGDLVRYEHLLSSIPLPQLRTLLDPLPADIAQALEALRWISIAVVHLGIKGPPPAPWHWVYVADPEVIFYRVGIPSHYDPDAAPAGHHLLSAEISHAPWRRIDEKTLVPLTIKGLRRLGLVRSTSDLVMERPVRLTYGYPIYDGRYAWATTRLRDYLRQHGIVPIGRFGSWRYLSVEQTILDGQRAAQTIQGLTPSLAEGLTPTRDAVVD
jgi:protoporphyrinogen oxidase